MKPENPYRSNVVPIDSCIVVDEGISAYQCCKASALVWEEGFDAAIKWGNEPCTEHEQRGEIRDEALRYQEPPRGRGKYRRMYYKRKADCSECMKELE